MAGWKESLKPINTSFYDFEKLVTGGFVYVDKTAHDWRGADGSKWR